MADTILKLTVQGEALKAKIEQGDGMIPLEITRIVSASGFSPNPLILTDVINPQLEFGVTGRSTDGPRTTINTLLTNAGDPGGGIPPLAVGYSMSQVGFFAVDPDLGEILYRISQYDNPIYVPAASERGWTYTPTFNIVTGNATTVIIEINATGSVPMDVFIEHVDSVVMSTAGVHGIRFWDGYLQVWDGSEWLPAGGGPIIKTVYVGSQVGTLTEGATGTVTFPVATENIVNGNYTATVDNLPIGVTVQGQVAIVGHVGTLTLAGDTTTVEGVTNTLVLTLDGISSTPFTLIVSEPYDPNAQSGYLGSSYFAAAFLGE